MVRCLLQAFFNAGSGACVATFCGECSWQSVGRVPICYLHLHNLTSKILYHIQSSKSIDPEHTASEPTATEGKRVAGHF